MEDETTPAPTVLTFDDDLEVYYPVSDDDEESDDSTDLESYVSDVLAQIMDHAHLNQLFSHQQLDIYQWLLTLAKYYQS
jgi:hypothetical protein